MIRRASRPAFVTVLLSVLIVADDRVSPQAQAPPGGDAVSVGFLAVGRDGRPVMDLKSDEVQLRVNGRPRTITSLQRIDVAAASADAGAKPAGPPLPAPFGTNATGGGASGGGRMIFLVIEDSSFRPGSERLLKQSIDLFLNDLSAADRVALMTLPLTTVRTDLTTAAEVRQALAKVNGVAPQRASDDELSARTRETLEGMRALLGSLAGNQTPSTVLFFSSGLSGTTRVTGKMGTSSGDLSTEHFLNVGAAAAAARAQLYVIQGDLTVGQRSDGLENLAGVTGSQVMVLAAAGENPLNRIALETSSTYVAAFDPEPSERNGQHHRLELRITRADVTARAGSHLTIARTDAKSSRKGAASPRDMLRESTVYRDLPLRVAAFPSRDADGKVKVVVVGEPSDSSGKITAASIGLYDMKGKLHAQSTAQADMLVAMPMTFAVVVPPGTYRVRLAATDATGKGGTADYEVAADLVTAGALKLSALLLGVDAVGFKPVLQFRDEPAALATFELYGKPPTTLPLKLELAATADGPALQQAQPAGSGTKDPDRFLVNGTFQIGSLAPGDYVVRAIVGTPESGGEGRVTRTLRKVK
jgi:VWFA-related protein